MTDVSQSLVKKKIDEESKTLVPSIGREDITVIKGIGTLMAIKLRNHGFGTINSLAETTPKRLTDRIEGIGEITAQRFVEQARDLKRSKNLNNFTIEEESIHNSNSEEDIDIKSKNGTSFENEDTIESETDYPALKYVTGASPETAPIIKEFIAEQEAGGFEEDFEYEEVEDEFSEPERPELDDYEVVENDIPDSSPIISELSGIRDPLDDSLEADYLDEPEIEIPLSANDNQDKRIHVPTDAKNSIEIVNYRNFHPSTTSVERVDHMEIQKMFDTVASDLESLGFLVIKKTPELRAAFTGIDLLAVKLVRIKEYLDFIYIIPVKICPLKGNVIVSNDKIEYNPFKADNGSKYNLNRAIDSYFQGLSTAGQNIFENFLHEGNLFQFVSKYLHIDICLKKTIMSKSLFFHSGPLEYRLLIEPLLACQNKVGFTERLIPFAYHTTTNIHVIELAQVSNLMQYLDQKYFLVETYTEKETTYSKYRRSSELFMNHLRLLSIPFIGYG
ncbi:MAG: helix-hairpin-helix domain-containing protein, partial [Promethearchaeota archaeon]